MHLFTTGLAPHQGPTPAGLELRGVLIGLRAQRRFRVEKLREPVARTAQARATAGVAAAVS